MITWVQTWIELSLLSVLATVMEVQVLKYLSLDDWALPLNWPIRKASMKRNGENFLVVSSESRCICLSLLFSHKSIFPDGQEVCRLKYRVLNASRSHPLDHGQIASPFSTPWQGFLAQAGLEWFPVVNRLPLPLWPSSLILPKAGITGVHCRAQL